MTLNQEKQRIADSFKKEFGDLTLGTRIPSDKNFVFVNNDLEMPRLENFISQSLDALHAAVVSETRKEIYDSIPKPESWDTWSIERQVGFNLALSEIHPNKDKEE